MNSSKRAQRSTADVAAAMLEELSEDFERCLHEEHYASAKQLLAGLIALVGEDNPEALYGRALLAWQEAEDHQRARRLLEAAVRADEEFADARHALGSLCDLLGDHKGCCAQWSAVLALDLAADQAQGLETESALEHISTVAQTFVRDLPQQFAEPLRLVPIVLEARPHAGLVAEGFDPRALGLFEGTEHANSGSMDQAWAAPTRIVLFTANLLASFPDPDRLEQEVEVTLLHEVGHYFGLDEDEVDALGLA